jgi:glycosyltransferase involved in cell wall biosynthesis
MGEGYDARLGQTVPMKLVLVVPGGVDPPGSPRVIPFIHHLVADLSAAHDVHVIAVGHDAAAGTWPLFGATVTNVPVGRHSKTDIARVIRTVASLAGRRGRPDVVHGLWANLPGLAASLAARRHRVPSVVSVCGGEFAALADIGYGGALSRGGLLMARAATRSATVTTAATDWMMGHVAAAGGRVDELIPLGADLSTFSTSRQPPVADRLVHVGNLNRVKDQTLLLHAFQRVVEQRPDATLDIAGMDTLHGATQALADELGVADRVRFTGYLQPEALASVLRTASVHVLSSRHDAGPIAVLEAAACAVPTVGTAVGHVADFAAMTPPAAVAVSDRRPAALADAVVELLNDDARRTTLGERALAWSTTHDRRATSQCFEALYRRLAASS